MKFLNILLGVAAAGSALAAPAADAPTPTTKDKRASKFKFVGVNQSGAEFGKDTLPGQLGKHYIWPAKSSIDWQLLLTMLMLLGRYYEQIISDVDGFKAWWTTTAKLFASNNLVIFDTNNEYHDMDNSLVFQLNQAAIDGIRAAGATSQLIFIEGNSWSGAWTWVSSGNGASLPNLQDPLGGNDKLIYEMHQYLDSDGSGTSEACVSSTIGAERLRAATAWLKAHGKRAILGETAGGANAPCVGALTGMLSYMAANADVWTGWLWWGGGPWWGSYMYSILATWGTYLVGVCFHPIDAYSRGGLGSLAALARTNRRLSALVDPVLYGRGIQCHSHLPLAWAAKFGVPSTLRKALAAGASPNHSFRAAVSHEVWELANDMHQASRDWSNNEPTYWPPMDSSRAYSLSMVDAHWARDMTPTMAELDVVAATPFMPVNPAQEPAGDDTRSPVGSDDPESDLESDLESDYVFREYTALHLAAKEGHNDIVSILLDHGALVDSLSRYFCGCALPCSLWQTLLESGRNNLGLEMVPLLDPGNRTPLHVAICSSRIETAKLLVSRRAVAHVPGSLSCEAALHQAAAAGRSDLVEHILNTDPKLNVDQRDAQEGLFALYHAYANGHWDSTVPLLLARGANIDLCFKVGIFANDRYWLYTTLLGEACRLGRFEDAIKLIDLGAHVSGCIRLPQNHPVRRDSAENEDDPDIIELPGSSLSPLHLCCMDFSRDSDMYPSHGKIWEPALMQRSSRSKLVARLVAAGISPDAQWNTGNGCEETPLSVATKHLNIAAVKALLNVGADVNAHNSRGRNALMAAVLKRDCHMCQSRQQSLDWGTWRFLPCHYADLPLPGNDYPDRRRIAQLLLDAGAHVNHQDSEGNSILHLFFTEAYGSSPWSCMERQARRQLICLLLARGADPCIRNGAGASVLRLAVKHVYPDALQIISGHCHIDLVDSLPVDEIASIFDALPWDKIQIDNDEFGEEHGTFSNEDDDGFTTAHCMIDALMGMDPSGRVALNVPFICEKLRGNRRSKPTADLAEALCFRGLERAGFDQAEKQVMLHAAIDARQWHIAHRLLEEMPEVHDINVCYPNGHSLLSQLTSSKFTRHAALEAIDIQLVEAGADVHLFLTSTTVDLSSVDMNLMTPLKHALICPDSFHIDQMLQKQPIRGNPQAAVPLYLHWAVTLPWRPFGMAARVSWSERDASIRALLAAGADPCQLDELGRTPWLLLLRELAEDDEDIDSNDVRHTCHWFKPLSRGIDINHANQGQRSVADYLKKLLADRFAAKVLAVYLELVTLEGGKKHIKWLK
ncbi:hypothetical protein C8A00DRAFT_18441 [Chaetomidium leptoderma]|uniref:cellulase n=1 Tax=Chaetomidium leptoderma TaxID=669021 RepID=A0AAN6ZT39_9PEZI|nr:hypothetical protein C8A00DRAFT_18441 [Chaetomidium leptoderma]